MENTSIEDIINLTIIKLKMSDEKKTGTQKTKDEQWSALIRVVELFRRYHTGEATQRERNIIDTWDPEEDGSTTENDETLEKECDTGLVWNAVSRELQFDQRTLTVPKRHFSLRRYSRQLVAAASVILILGVGITFWYSTRDGDSSAFFVQQAPTKTLFQTTDAQTKSIILPDGSRIQMNRGTKFSYATHAFNRKQREVWLEGEAFFEVAKNKEKPFIIHTGAMQTTVRGTSFNVKAYPQLNENIVSVRSGKVEVNDATHTFGLLTHNKQLTYNTSTKNSLISESNWEDAAGWTKGRLVLNGGIEELSLRLRQQFGVEVSFEKNALANERLTGTFDKTSKLTDVLTTIGAIYNIRYTIKNNHVTISPLSSN